MYSLTPNLKMWRALKNREFIFNDTCVCTCTCTCTCTCSRWFCSCYNDKRREVLFLTISPWWCRQQLLSCCCMWRSSECLVIVFFLAWWCINIRCPTHTPSTIMQQNYFVRVPVLLLKSGSLLLLVQPWNNGSYFSQSNMILAQRRSNSPKVSKNESIHPPWSMNNKQPTSNIKHQIFVINRQYKYKYNTREKKWGWIGIIVTSFYQCSLVRHTLTSTY